MRRKKVVKGGGSMGAEIVENRRSRLKLKRTTPEGVAGESTE